MQDQPLKVLLVEDQLDDILLIEEALSELEELQYVRPWLQPCSLTQTESIGETMDLLERASFDLMLVDVNLPDGHAAQALRLVRLMKPDLPVIVLANPELEADGAALIRQGAQDCLLKSELDCLPLARSIRYALERQRLVSALRSLSQLDELTGLYTEAGFLRVMRCYGHAAAETGAEFSAHLFELHGLTPLRSEYGSPEADRALVHASGVLRQVFGDAAPIGRLAEARFGALAFRPRREERLAERVRTAVEAESAQRGGRCPLTVSCGFARGHAGAAVEAILDEAERALCKNSRSQLAANG